MELLLSTLPAIRRSPSSRTMLTPFLSPQTSSQHGLSASCDSSPTTHFPHRHANTHRIINKCGRFIEARIQQRIRQLEAMPAAMANGFFDPNVDVTEDSSIKHVNSNPQISETLQCPNPPKLCMASFTLSSNSNLFVSSRNDALFMPQLLRVSLAEQYYLSTILAFITFAKPTICDARMTKQLKQGSPCRQSRWAGESHTIGPFSTCFPRYYRGGG